jgi:hypothetical protein
MVDRRLYLVSIILTGRMTNIVAHGFLHAQSCIIIIAGWLIHFQNPRIAKWFLGLCCRYSYMNRGFGASPRIIGPGLFAGGGFG